MEARTGQANAALAKTQANLKKTATVADASTMAMGKRFASAGTSLRSTGKSLTHSVSLPLIAIGGYAIKSSLDFHRAMVLIQTQAGASAKEVDKMSERVLAFAQSGKTDQGPKALADSLYRVESAGIRGGRAMKTLRSASNLAMVGQADLEQTTKALVAAQKTGIRGAGNLKKEIATLNSTVGHGQMRMDDLVSAMGTGFLSAAAGLGLSLKEVGGALAELTKQGIPATQAATRLRMTFSLIANPTTKAVTALKGIGISQTDLAMKMRGPQGLVGALALLRKHLGPLNTDLQKTKAAQLLAGAFGGAKSGSTIVGLIQKLGDLRKTTKEVTPNVQKFNQSLGAAKATSAEELKIAWAHMQGALVKLGDVLIPVIIPALQKLAGFIGGAAAAFQKLSPDTQKFIVYAALAAVAVGPLLVALGAMATAIGAISAPVALGVAAFGALAGGFVVAYKSSNSFRESISSVGKSFRSIFQNMNTIIHGWAFQQAMKISLNIAKRVFPAIGQIMQGFAQTLKGIVEVITGLLTLRFGKVWQGLKDIFGGGVKTVIGQFRALTAPLRGTINQIGKMFGGFGSMLAGKISDGVKAGLNAVISFINAIIDVLDKIPFVEIGHVGKVGGGGGGGRAGARPGSRTGRTHGGHQVAGHHQRGAVIVPGHGSGDKVAAMLEPGEVVINRKAVAAMGGARKANAVNQMIPRFAGPMQHLALGGIGHAIGSAAGAVKGLPGKAVGLAGKGAGFFIDQLPHFGGPPWLAGLGDALGSDAASFAEKKVSGALGSAKSGAGAILEKLPHLRLGGVVPSPSLHGSIQPPGEKPQGLQRGGAVDLPPSRLLNLKLALDSGDAVKRLAVISSYLNKLVGRKNVASILLHSQPAERALKTLQAKLEKVAHRRYRAMLEVVDKAKGTFQQAAKYMAAGWARRTFRATMEIKDDAKAKVQALGDRIAKVVKARHEVQVTAHTKEAQAAVEQMGKKLGGLDRVSTKTHTAVAGEFRQMAGDVSTSIRNMGSAVSSALSQLGAKGAAVHLGGGGKPQSRQAGGVIVPGTGSGDKVEAAIPPKSFILNRKATEFFFQGGGVVPVRLEPGERAFMPQEVSRIGLPKLQQMNAAVPRFVKGGKIPEQRVSGLPGAPQSAANRGLDRVHAAALAYLREHTPKAKGLPGGGVSVGPIQKMAQAMVRQVFGGGQWGAFNALEMSEAGWNPRALNSSSGAAGLAQALPASKYPAGAWPYKGPESAKLQLQWMMSYIKGRYGTPGAAWAFHKANNWYQSGGIVQKLAKGGLIQGLKKGGAAGRRHETPRGITSGVSAEGHRTALSASVREGTQKPRTVVDEAPLMRRRGGIIQALQRGGVVQALRRGGAVRGDDAEPAQRYGVAKAVTRDGSVQALRAVPSASVREPTEKPRTVVDAIAPRLQKGGSVAERAVWFARGAPRSAEAPPQILHRLLTTAPGREVVNTWDRLPDKVRLSYGKRHLKGLVSHLKPLGYTVFEDLSIKMPSLKREAREGQVVSRLASGGIVPAVVTAPSRVAPAWASAERGLASGGVVQKLQGGGIVQKLQGGRVAGHKGDPRVPDKGHTRRTGPLARPSGGGAQTLDALISVANAVDAKHLPYVWGGGHSQPASLGSGVDCSGAVSYLLQQAGFNTPTQVSGGFMSAFESGPGKDFSIYASPTHVFTGIGNKQWGTSDANPGGGAGWFAGHSTSGMTARHPILAKAAATASSVAGKAAPLKPHLSKHQGSRLKRLKNKIKKMGLAPKQQAIVDSLTADVEKYGEFADRASQLSTDTTKGVIQGQDETGWLTKELEALFGLRNALIRVQEAAAKAREKIAKQMRDAQKILSGGGSAVYLSAEDRKRIQKRLDHELAKPKGKQDQGLIAGLRKRLKGDSGGRVTPEQKLFETQLMKSLTAQDTALSGNLSTTKDSLLTVQGLGSSAGVMKSLSPAQAVLTFGGSIFDTAKSLLDLGANQAVTDTSSGSTDLLAQLLRESNQRTAVSQAQYDVFRNFPPFGGMFALGGKLAAGKWGIAGEGGHPEIVTGPAVIHSPSQSAAMMAPSQSAAMAPEIHVHVDPAMSFLRDYIRVEVKEQGKRDGRYVGRTPGRAGSLRG